MSNTLTAAPLNATPQWANLTSLAAEPQPTYRERFAEDSSRARSWTFPLVDLHVDLSKTPYTPALRDALLALAECRGLRESTEAMFRGDRINTSEHRSVLHTALRAPRGHVTAADGTRIDHDVHQVLDAFLAFADQVRDGSIKGITGERFTDVINIGIGGSDLGPAMAYQALRPFTSHELTCHFVSNVDPADIDSVLTSLDPTTTLVIVTSKTFTTQETMTNAAIAKQWLLDGLTDHPAEAVTAAHCTAQ
ncbi:scavenger receptor cysteine-rich domain-containing group B protein [Platysternon megacephalum]|uniref:Scavenger receptor cysteine-rich domain-containing group B protein n=1 Tax=Platysternon megacephalum TaxID=55544 RepID=A0A4D9DBC2_9SAUR|nr:scavenger receptor cysteine-rich domain-containing group B protein [Platysternon megacephalum]